MIRVNFIIDVWELWTLIGIISLPLLIGILKGRSDTPSYFERIMAILLVVCLYSLWGVITGLVWDHAIVTSPFFIYIGPLIGLGLHATSVFTSYRLGKKIFHIIIGITSGFIYSFSGGILTTLFTITVGGAIGWFTSTSPEYDGFDESNKKSFDSSDFLTSSVMINMFVFLFDGLFAMYANHQHGRNSEAEHYVGKILILYWVSILVITFIHAINEQIIEVTTTRISRNRINRVRLD